MDIPPINGLPRKFVEVIGAAHGQAGWEWLEHGLPQTIVEVEKAWDVRCGRPYDNLSYHFVAPCEFSDGSEAVIKIGFPEPDSPMPNEAAVLTAYAGRGAVNVLRHGTTRFATLLEKIDPGKSLKTCFQNDPRSAVDVAVQLLKRLGRIDAGPAQFAKLYDWIAAMDERKRIEFPSAPIDKAVRFYNDLSRQPAFLIHGDFHNDNILSATREPFLVIDPKGLLGHLWYETSVFLNNHANWLGPSRQAEVLLAADAFAAEFDIDALVLRRGAYIQAVLSAYWTWEENTEAWKNEVSLAEIWQV